MKHDTIVNQPVINAERIVLRPLRRSDQGLIEMYAGDKDVAANTTSIPHPLPPGSIEALIQRAQSEDRMEDIWAMDGTADSGPEVMGVIGLTRVDHGKSEIGYWVAPAFWNTGLASEAVRTLIAANPLQSDTRVLTNCGFQYLGDAESFSVARDAAVPTWTYSLKQS